MALYIKEAAWQSGEGAGREICRSRVQFSLWPSAGFVAVSTWFNSSAGLVYSQLVYFLSVGILNLFSFICCISGPQCQLLGLPVIVWANKKVIYFFYFHISLSLRCLLFFSCSFFFLYMNLPCSVHSAANNDRSSDISRAKFTHFRLMVRQNVQTFFKSNIFLRKKSEWSLKSLCCH